MHMHASSHATFAKEGRVGNKLIYHIQQRSLGTSRILS